MRQRDSRLPQERRAWKPRPGSWVRLAGRDGIFVVLYLDESRGVADLLLMDQIRAIENDVAIGQLLELQLP